MHSVFDKFGPIANATGAMGFFGEGYDFHRILKPFGLDYSKAGFTAKTTTLLPKRGNALIDMESGELLELFPDCIKIDFANSAVLNAFGLSSPGAEKLFLANRWQKITKPFFISFMAIAKTLDERIRELREFVKIFQFYLKDFKALTGLEINVSCPNVKLVHSKGDELADEIVLLLIAGSELNIPLRVKINVLTPVEAILEVEKRVNRLRSLGIKTIPWAIALTNTVPWGELPDKIDWDNLFELRRCFQAIEKNSPLEKYGGGGLSHQALLPLVLKWMQKARDESLCVHIHAGGGVRRKKDVKMLFDAGADSVFMVSISLTRPWRVKGIIDYAHSLDRKIKREIHSLWETYH